MIKNKKYHIINFMGLYINLNPIQSLLSLIYNIIKSFIPALQTLAIGYFINNALDIFCGNKEYSSIYLPLLLIMTCVLFDNLMPVIVGIIDLSGRNTLMRNLKTELVHKRASLMYIHIEDNATCEMINRVCNGAEDKFMNGFKGILNGIGLSLNIMSLLFIVMTSTILGGLVIFLVCIPLLYYASKLGKNNYELEKDAENVKRINNYLSDVLINREFAEERKLFRYSKAIAKKYNELFDFSYRIESNIEKKRYFNMKTGSLATIFIGLIIMGILLPYVNKGAISIGIYVALVSAIFNLVQSMSWQLAGAMHDIASLKVYLKEFTTFISLSEKESACDVPVKKESFEFKTLEFRNVTFRYPGTQKDILSQCSFKLYHNTSYAFVGVNGAGKSTITKLITGLYDNYEGEILINDIDIKEYQYSELKYLIGVVFQDYAKYALTVRSNVTLGNITKQNKNEVNKVLEEIGLKNVISNLSRGLDTNLGKIYDDGTDFSGGQWQRLAIARLLYSDSQINILDEPTAAIDPIAESAVYHMFSKINKQRFTLYITHRLGAAKIANEILVLDKGYIVEQGNHEKLMSLKNGLYRQMFESQKSWYE